MRFAQKLQAGILVRRYKRFLADVRLASGETITIHCPNSGSMLGCSDPGSPVCFSESSNPKRKYAHTLEMVQVAGSWVGVNTARTNALVREAIEAGRVREFAGVGRIDAEVRTSENSRLDFLLHRGGEKIYLEVKNCSLAEGGVALFPDAVTARGTKHLEELLRLRRQGHGAAVFFCVQRGDAESFRPASQIDPLYGRTLAEAAAGGVQVLAYRAEVSPAGIEVAVPLPVFVG